MDRGRRRPAMIGGEHGARRPQRRHPRNAAADLAGHADAEHRSRPQQLDRHRPCAMSVPISSMCRALTETMAASDVITYQVSASAV